jgi:hypothetical protein
MRLSIHTPFKRIGGEELQGFGKFFALKKPWKAFDYSDSEFFFGFIGASFGGGWLPEGRNVAQVFPDSGLNWAVLPGTGGMRTR